MEQEAFAPGAVIAGKYEVLKTIGQGGSGTVYLVMDTNIRKNWAMKAVRKSGDGEDGRAAFVTEIRMLRDLAHPRLPRIVDALEGGDSFYVVMDFIEGRTLEQVLKEEGPQKARDVAAWAREICGVLGYLHGRTPPVLYLDMKPHNIMLRPEGGVMLLDMGIARRQQGADGAGERREGTPGYAAPELCAAGTQVDAAADIYGLGATMYCLLTGAPPRDPAMAAQTLRQMKAGIGGGLAEIVCKCLSAEKAARFRSAAELSEALAHYRQMDETSLKKERRKIMTFAAALMTGIAGMAFSVSGHAGIRAETGQRYVRLLTEADTLAEEKGTENFASEVLSKYLEAMDLAPSREDAYLRALDYCAGAGHTGSGLRPVCARIDAGVGGIDGSDLVLSRVADLYFSGNAKDSGFSGDYRKAARYYALVDRRSFPEAVYYASIAEAMSDMGGRADWKRAAEMLRCFEAYNAGVTNGVKRIRGALAAAGVYSANRQAFLAEGIDASGRAIRLLEEADRDAEALLLAAESGVSAETDAGELKELGVQVLKNLGAAGLAALSEGNPAMSASETAGVYERLIRLAGTPEEIEEARFHLADVLLMEDDGARGEEMLKELVRLYPEHAKAYLSYAAYLLGRDRNEEALAMIRQAEGCPDIGEAPSYRSLLLKALKH